jgi:hypothetical protein
MKKFLITTVVVFAAMVFFTDGFAKKRLPDPCAKKCNHQESDCFENAKKMAPGADRKAENIKCDKAVEDCKKACEAARNKPKG